MIEDTGGDGWFSCAIEYAFESKSVHGCAWLVCDRKKHTFFVTRMTPQRATQVLRGQQPKVFVALAVSGVVVGMADVVGGSDHDSGDMFGRRLSSWLFVLSCCIPDIRYCC